MKSTSNPSIAVCLTTDAMGEKVKYYIGKRAFYRKLLNAPAEDYAHIPTLSAMDKEMLQRRTEYYASMALRWQTKLDIRKALESDREKMVGQ